MLNQAELVNSSADSLHTTLVSGNPTLDVNIVSGGGSGDATAANQVTGNASLASIDTKLTAPLTVTGPLTDAQLRAVAVPVSGTFFQATQPVSIAGTVTVTGAGGTFPVTDSGGSLTVDGTVTTSAPSVTPAQSNVASSASSVTLLASNASRKSYSLYNDSTQYCYVSLSGTASATNFMIKLAPNALYEPPANVNYTGIILGIWVSANGAMRVTEYV